MDTGPWNECVPVRLPNETAVHMVSNTRQAAELLAKSWPVSHGKAYENAIEVCLAVLERDYPSYIARAAFVAAAKEAQVYLLN
ncbi:DUF982 domain-containing protein [Sinorhizobium numidicum]|uniref:DUF982 domain-containing protein n=1 Tax=Sinorhizobium numidicum TaxID=680248 RepID=A0ABY8CS92_9HYPH|nr:DUF982 domain-containing protein [Sinorhizobium numidicum]WEX74215.1 DUF982 domain-containing protein [Sinorhizobium numidicum]WEX80200.1 DUF982 domain-containing protein [Sinorhizobium numidicum]